MIAPVVGGKEALGRFGEIDTISGRIISVVPMVGFLAIIREDASAAPGIVKLWRRGVCVGVVDVRKYEDE